MRRNPSGGSDEIVGVVVILVLVAGLVWLVILQGCLLKQGGRSGAAEVHPSDAWTR